MHSGVLLDLIGGPQVSPVTNAVGAVTLALAAACATKAVALSLQHRPSDPGLAHAIGILGNIARFSLVQDEQDGEAFADFLKAHAAAATRNVTCAGDRLFSLIDLLSQTVDRTSSLVEPQMAGDLAAARVLMQAACRIQVSHCDQAHREWTLGTYTT